MEHTDNLPIRLEKTVLVFNLKDGGVEKLEIPFESELPGSFFLKKGGNFFYFCSE